jgi:DNA polymerase elongation subunit (family B)
MSYVAAWHDYRKDKVVVMERHEDGSLVRKLYEPPFYFYIPDNDGEYETIHGDRATRLEFDSNKEYKAAKDFYQIKYESDISPTKRVLSERYYGVKPPIPNYAFFDIEVDYKSEIGFAGPKNPYAPINAVTVYQSWTKKYLTAVVPPKEWKGTEKNLYACIDKLISKKLLRKGIIPEIVICKSEFELLIKMISWLNDADIISGWNSEFYDIPYTCIRLEKAGGTALLNNIDYPGAPSPTPDTVRRFGEEEIVYKLNGKAHLDYMRLFQKFTFEGRESFALGNILEEEVGIGKLEYDGSLEQLYHDDFETFTAYNFRDVDGLVQLNEKFKFIALANQMAHENTVPYSAVLGTVSYVESGMINHAHFIHKKIVHDKTINKAEKVEGAIVMTPKIGLHEWIGSVDINSLYPNTIRSLNISPEKIIGQFSGFDADFLSIKADESKSLTLLIEGGGEHTTSIEEWKRVLTKNQWAVSGYGTVFDQSGDEGLVPSLLGFWYSERKKLQAEKKRCHELVMKLEKELGVTKSDPTRSKRGKKYYLAEELELILKAEAEEEHFDLLQLTKKISLNSAYGALLNAAFRFGDERMGASVTASGRAITTHMLEELSYQLTGERVLLDKHSSYDKKGRLRHDYSSKSEVILYGDTDSVAADSVVRNSLSANTIEELFDMLPARQNHGEKEFALPVQSVTVPCYTQNGIVNKPIRAVYRHKVSKKKFKITLSSGKSVIVTEDHSVMVMRNGELIEVKPNDINRDTDYCISIGNL